MRSRIRSHHPVHGCYCAVCWPPRPQPKGFGQATMARLARSMDYIMPLTDAEQVPTEAMAGALARIQGRLG